MNKQSSNKPKADKETIKARENELIKNLKLDRTKRDSHRTDVLIRWLKIFGGRG